MARTPVLPDTPSFRASSFRKYVWRYKTVLETTFGISVLEPWEKLIFSIFMSLLSYLFITGCIRYLIPQRFIVIQHRLSYYLWGDEGGEYGHGY